MVPDKTSQRPFWIVLAVALLIYNVYAQQVAEIARAVQLRDTAELKTAAWLAAERAKSH